MLAQNHHRSALFSFVRQMQGVNDTLTALLDSLLDGENMDVMLRGVYLTSSLQRGQVDDIFTQSAARQYQLGSSPLIAWPWWTPHRILPATCFHRRCWLNRTCPEKTASGWETPAAG
jgi:type VI protein secretion system component VasK